MKINIEIGKQGKLKNKNNIFVKITRFETGYFIITENNKIGPFSDIFLEKKNDDELIVACVDNDAYFYKLNSKGLSLKEIIKISTNMESDINNYLKNNSLEELDNLFIDCKLVGKKNKFSIYLDSNNDLFVVDSSLPLKDVDEYKKFEDYESLLKYYDEKNIDLFIAETYNKTKKFYRNFINFNDFISYPKNLKINDLSHTELINIVTGKDFFKDFFYRAKKNYIKISKTDEKANEYLNNGYVELKYFSLDKMKENYSEEINEFIKCFEEKKLSFSQNAINFIKDNDSIDFEKLAQYLDKITISDIDIKAQREIGAKRPLTIGIFTSILTAIIDKYNEENTPIDDDYKMPKNLKAIYEDQYEILFNLTNDKMENLYNQLLVAQKEKFDKLIKSKK